MFPKTAIRRVKMIENTRAVWQEVESGVPVTKTGIDQLFTRFLIVDNLTCLRKLFDSTSLSAQLVESISFVEVATYRDFRGFQHDRTYQKASPWRVILGAQSVHNLWDKCEILYLIESVAITQKTDYTPGRLSEVKSAGMCCA